MTFARVFLGLVAAMSILMGLLYLVSPVDLSASAGFGDLLPGGTTDVRATYGGFQLGLGLFLAWSALEPARVRTGLLLTLLTFAAVATCRAIGVALDGSLNDFHQTGLIFEVTLTAIALVAVIKTPGQPATA